MLMMSGPSVLVGTVSVCRRAPVVYPCIQCEVSHERPSPSGFLQMDCSRLLQSRNANGLTGSVLNQLFCLLISCYEQQTMCEYKSERSQPVQTGWWWVGILIHPGESNLLILFTKMIRSLIQWLFLQVKGAFTVAKLQQQFAVQR